jgi:hypothetical protein
MFEDVDLNGIQEENVRELVKRLLNMIEQLSGEVREVREENQRLRDEINRMKGEQGQPKIQGKKKAGTPTGSTHRKWNDGANDAGRRSTRSRR